MREEVANLVYPVLTHGLRLKERLEDDPPPDFATSQKELLGLLQNAAVTQRWFPAADKGSHHDDSGPGRRSDSFLGIHYALVCWLDEIFILDSPWKDSWSEQSLEVGLYKTRERAWKFWEQADWASAQTTTDALEVFFLCVMLGFRGEKANKPEELRAWCEKVKAQIEHGQESSFSLPVDGQVRTFVPTLTGANRQQNMLAAAGVAMVLLIPAFMFFLVLILRGS